MRAILALIAFTVLFVWIARVTQLDLDSPLAYDSDAPEAMANFERAYIYNDVNVRLHAPFEITHDSNSRYAFNAVFKANSNLTWLCWLIAGGNDVRAYNLSYLAGFLLIFASAYWVFGQLRLGDPYRFCAASLYALMPYHFQRGTIHFLESSYYLIPLLALLLLRLWAARPLGHRRGAAGWEFHWRDWRAIGAFLLLVCLACFNPYYEFFFACLAACVAPLAALYRRNWRPLLLGLGMAAAAVAVLVIKSNLARWISAPDVALALNGQAISRYGEAEYYPLKLMQMILPVQGHRWAALAEVRAIYDEANPLNNENGTTTLGAIGACGMLACLLLALVPSAKLRSSRLGKMGLIILLAIAFAMMGGVSSLISMASYLSFGTDFELTQMRGWNRIVVFIAFFAYFAAFWMLRACLNFLRQRYFPQTSSRVLTWPVAGLVFAFALWDAVPAPIVQTAPVNYRSDQEFFARIEASLPAGARVMQLPYLIHHLSGWLQPGAYYTQAFRPYLNTRTLHFTYGGDDNSEQARWLKQAASLPQNEAAKFLCSYGFSGVLLARKMVKDPAQLQRSWTDALGAAPMQSTDGDHAFYDLRPFCSSHRIAVLDMAQIKRDLMAEHERGVHSIDALVFAREIGHPETQADGKVNVVANADDDGFLAYGPYETLSAGHYTATFSFAARDVAANAPSLDFDVAAARGARNAADHLASKNLAVAGTTSDVQALDLPFVVFRRAEKVEYRIHKSRGYAVRFIGVRIVRTDD